ncbi:MAG: hypothetical protein PHF51_04130 [Candidatus ainarchaeum sp.]|nr:hypothetical protein [Candidatus ainarchaeum sp.]
MACFAAPAALGAVTFLARKRFPADWHIDWLNTMIFGGTAALAVEHVAHGEIVPWPPFLTAMGNPADTMVMLQEIATVGMPMAVALVLAWAAMVVAYEKMVAAKKVPLRASGA